ncbi:MAG: YeeE/YedE family protein [Deltaproteobacteria bacterium]|nr:YeeE/YedE family protein [Deltaproteobacteria bacterium]
MTFPFWSLVAEHREAGLVVGVLIGVGFGFVLERAGFGRAQKLAAQFYGTDMTVFKVMFSAIVTAMLGMVLFAGLGLVDFKAVADNAVSSTWLWPMVAGGFALGVGFIVSGYCPGTSLVAAASGKVDGMVAVVGVVAGQVIWTGIEHLPAISRLQNASDLGHLYLWELLHLPPRAGPAIVAVAVTAMAVGCFLGAEKLERIFSRAAPPAAPRPRRLVFTGLAASALVGLGLGLVPVGTSAVAAAPQAIGPEALAERVLDQPWKVRVLDLRAREACAARRVPGAECVPAAELGKLGLADANGTRELVLVGEGTLQALPAAAAAYPGAVRVLEGGFPAWEAFALRAPEPPPAGASPAERERYRLRAGIAAALTGVKAAPPPPMPSGDAAPKKKAGGGGCGG